MGLALASMELSSQIIMKMSDQGVAGMDHASCIVLTGPHPQHGQCGLQATAESFCNPALHRARVLL